MGEPYLVGLLFADRVITEDNHKKGIIGTFTFFNSNQIPVIFPPWFIYSAATNITPGKHNFSLILSDRESQHVVFSIGGDFEVDDIKAVIEISIPCNAVFPKFGTYSLIFNIDGKEVGARFLEVRRTQGGGS